MQSRIWCAAALALWVIGAAIVGWIFVKGWITSGADGRTEIRLAPSERDQILKEMRQLLQAVHGVVVGLNAPEPDAKQVEQTARAVGMRMAADASPSIMMKLPLPFKQMGMSVHRDFDELADGIARGEQSRQTLNRLTSITSRARRAMSSIGSLQRDNDRPDVRHHEIRFL